MKIKVEDQVFKYPCILESRTDGSILLATGKGSDEYDVQGMIISGMDKFKCSCSWNKRAFKKFEGTITLEND